MSDLPPTWREGIREAARQLAEDIDRQAMERIWRQIMSDGYSGEYARDRAAKAEQEIREANRAGAQAMDVHRAGRLERDPWAHRSAGMRCTTCMWFVEKAGASKGVGRCRRHAPTMQGYPVVFSTDWCGDHKLDETKA